MRKWFRSSFKGLASRIVAPWFPRFGGYALWSSLLSGTNVDWNAKAGPRYTNSAVMAIIQYLQGGAEAGPRLIVQKPTRGKRGREWEEDDTHPLPQIVANGYRMTESQLIGGAIISLVVQGNAYWIVERNQAGQPLGYVFLPHWQLTPKSDHDFEDRRAGYDLITYYECRTGDGNVVEVHPDDVIHFRWGIDPANLMMGLSPLMAALREICTDNEAATLTASILANGGVLGWAISPKGTEQGAPLSVDPEQMAKTGRQLQRFTTGDMAGAPAPLPYPIEVTQLGYEPRKLALDVQRQMSVERILAQYGIDPMVLGLPSQSKTFSNFEEANEAAVRRALLRVLGIMAKTLTEQSLRVHFKGNTQRFSQERVSWDLSEVNALQPDQGAIEDRFLKLFQGDLIKRSEARAGLGYAGGAEDDVYCSQYKANLISDKMNTKDEPGEDDKAKADKSKLDKLKEKRALEAVYGR